MVFKPSASATPSPSPSRSPSRSRAELAPATVPAPIPLATATTLATPPAAATTSTTPPATSTTLTTPPATSTTLTTPPATSTTSTTATTIRILSASDISSVLPDIPTQTLLASQSTVFQSLSAKSASIQTPHRATLSSDEQTVLVMPGKAGTDMAVKIVSVPCGSSSDGLPASTVVIDSESGKVTGLVNARLLTALRNAAGSALFLQEFPNPSVPTNIVLFGSGAQSQAHANLLLTLYPSLKSCTIVVRSETERATSLVSTLENLFPNVKVTLGLSSSEAFNLPQTVHNANIIITATPSLSPLFNSVDVTSGTRVVCIGSYKPHMHEIQGELVRRAGLVVVDSREACAKEAGELISAGITQEGMIELGEVLSDDRGDDVKIKVQQSGDIVLFKSVGVGIQDVAVAKVVLDEAERRGVGTVIQDYD
ncbi:hypothetical protein BCR39DRAFT_517682 [Naematelia encephala]|uniref:Ornithine cyclodeaminase n=1 Tax=Naematelia encephala TaxID=71784 RepID=A0A1Y2BHQ0_9TREE|nr:hypothetical protein BCR39DRAFT_517682 [Naematelia encephala]